MSSGEAFYLGSSNKKARSLQKLKVFSFISFIYKDFNIDIYLISAREIKEGFSRSCPLPKY